MRAIEELRAEINKLPAEHQPELLKHIERVEIITVRRKRICGLVQEALAQLRLDMKYLFFDLDCTKRERDEARTT